MGIATGNPPAHPPTAMLRCGIWGCSPFAAEIQGWHCQGQVIHLVAVLCLSQVPSPKPAETACRRPHYRLGLRSVRERPLEATGTVGRSSGGVQAWSCDKGPSSCRQSWGALKSCCKRPALGVNSLISLSLSRIGRAPFPQIKAQAGLYRCLQGPGVKLKESVVSNRVKLLHYRDWTSSSIVPDLQQGPELQPVVTNKNPTLSCKFRWSPEATGPGNKQIHRESVTMSASTHIRIIIPPKSSQVNQGT